MTYIGNDKYEVYIDNQTINISIEEAKNILMDIIGFENKSSHSDRYIGLTEYHSTDLMHKDKNLKNDLSDEDISVIDEYLEAACELQEYELNDKYVLIER